MLAIEALRRYTPGCADARLRNFGMTIGIRDTRKIDAVYNLTESDVRGGAVRRQHRDLPEFIDGYGVLVLPTTGRYLQIPYRSLLPRTVRDLIVAGRATGGDRIAHAATRNMSCCAVTGQGAGVAAAESIRADPPWKTWTSSRSRRSWSARRFGSADHLGPVGFEVVRHLLALRVGCDRRGALEPTAAR